LFKIILSIITKFCVTFIFFLIVWSIFSKKKHESLESRQFKAVCGIGCIVGIGYIMITEKKFVPIREYIHNQS
jgi:hypothetical protein